MSKNRRTPAHITLDEYEKAMLEVEGVGTSTTGTPGRSLREDETMRTMFGLALTCAVGMYAMGTCWPRKAAPTRDRLPSGATRNTTRNW